MAKNCRRRQLGSIKKAELLTLALPSELAAGNHTLALRFVGKINQQGQGLFYMRYQEQGSGVRKVMLGTQFEATDARRFFPCWDEPAFRARFQLTVVVPENWLAVSNMPIESETKSRRAKKCVSPPTPPMSSYLNVFVAGELDFIESRAGPTQIRVIATKGKANWAAMRSKRRPRFCTTTTITSACRIRCRNSIKSLFPAASAARWKTGAESPISNRRFYSIRRTPPPRRNKISIEVIAHEMAHMWFGDLVTMAWWDNLWLNEGFASWMGTQMHRAFQPAMGSLAARKLPRDPTRRTGIAKEAAMEGDARSTTHPIQQPVATEAEANSAFDDITYKKGQSFLRMLESFLGEDVFRDGIRRYIAAHKYSNATTADLVERAFASFEQTHRRNCRRLDASSPDFQL